MAMAVEKKWHGAVVDARMRAGAVRGIQLATEHLLTESRRIVPLETGDLERSGTASVDEGELRGCVAYLQIHAVRQHEEMDWNHAPGRSSKYLENPLLRESQRMNEIIATQIRRGLR